MRTDLGSACSNRIVIFTPSPAPITTACKTHASKDARTISGPRDSLQLQNAITAQAHPMPTIQLSCDSTSQTAPSSGCSDSLQGHQGRVQASMCSVCSAQLRLSDSVVPCCASFRGGGATNPWQAEFRRFARLSGRVRRACTRKNLQIMIGG